MLSNLRSRFKDWLMSILIYDEVRYGCGSGIFYIEKEKTHYEACKGHDIAYANGSMPRHEIDRKFLQDMIKSSDGNIRHLFRAYLYYIIVRLFGRIFYKGKK